MPPIFAASSREAPSSTAAIANSRRACAAWFRSLGKPANLAGGVVRPHRNSMAHGKPPQFAILNHASNDSGIPRESATQRIGISPNNEAWVNAEIQKRKQQASTAQYKHAEVVNLV